MRRTASPSSRSPPRACSGVAADRGPLSHRADESPDRPLVLADGGLVLGAPRTDYDAHASALHIRRTDDEGRVAWDVELPVEGLAHITAIDVEEEAAIVVAGFASFEGTGESVVARIEERCED